jgi:hypothetical protein
MMKKRKFGSGGMPSMKESMESGNRAEKMNRDEMQFMGVGQKPKKKPMPATRSTLPSMKDIVDAGNRASALEGAEMRFMEMMEPKQNRQSMPMRSGKPPVYGVGKPAFPDSAASAASADRIAKQEADEKKLMDAMRGRDEGPRKPVTLKEKPVPVDLDEKRKKVRLNEKRIPVTLDEKRVRVDKMEYKTGGKVQTSSNTARKLASEMGGMKKGGKVAKPPVKKMAKGGSVSSRADGCAVRGKTKGKMR